MGFVAEETNDEVPALQANGDRERCSACFFPDQTVEFCLVAEYIYDNIGRYTAVVEDKARMMAEKHGLRRQT